MISLTSLILLTIIFSIIAIGSLIYSYKNREDPMIVLIMTYGFGGSLGLILMVWLIKLSVYIDKVKWGN